MILNAQKVPFTNKTGKEIEQNLETTIFNLCKSGVI